LEPTRDSPQTHARKQEETFQPRFRSQSDHGRTPLAESRVIGPVDGVPTASFGVRDSIFRLRMDIPGDAEKTTGTIPARSGRHPAEAVFRSLSEAFSNARKSRLGDVWERRFSLARHSVRLRSNSEALLGLLYAPFSHLPAVFAAETCPDLNIDVVAGVPREAIVTPSDWDGAGLDTVVGRHRMQASTDGRFVCHEFLDSGSLWCLDRSSGRISGWVDSLSGLTLYERGRPLVRLLALWLERSGLQMIHAGMASWRGQGVFFVGPGGSGKSTAALCCVRGGLDFIGEDYVALGEAADGHFTGYSLYNSLWIAPDHLFRFGDLAALAAPGGEVEQRKSMLMLADVFAGRLAPSAPARFLMLPRVRPEGATAVSAASKPAALKQMAPNCLIFGTRLGKHGFEALVRLVRKLDCYWLDLGNDLEEVPGVVRAVIESRT